MPHTIINNCSCYYEIKGDKTKPTVVFAHSLGCDMHIWQKQLDVLKDDYCVILYDIRGHGKSEYKDVPYDIALLGSDVLGLLDFLQIPQAFFVGISLGGLIGQWLAIHAASRFKGMVWANTAAKIGLSQDWYDRAELVKAQGMKPIADEAPKRWFTGKFLLEMPDIVDTVQHTLLRTSADGYAACCLAIANADFRSIIQLVELPVLILAGNEDKATTVLESTYMADELKNGQLKILEASHLSNLEDATSFNKNLIAFLSDNIQTMSKDG